METITIGSAITADRLDLLYILMNSIKAHKLPATQIDYYVFSPFTGNTSQKYYESYFSDLQDATFHIHVLDVLPVIKRMGRLNQPLITYTRCFFPVLFPELERMLYLDADVLCHNSGIEAFWNTDLTDCYAAVAQDPAIMWTDRYKFERDNTGLTRYFNAGIQLMNFAAMRRDGIDKELEAWCRDWNYDVLTPHHHDQTLMNWLYKGRVKWMPITHNNQLLTSWGYKAESFERQAREDGYSGVLDTLKDTLFLHFCDHSKPWVQLPYPDSAYPYIQESRAIWKEAVAKYAKKTNSLTTIQIATQATFDRKENVYILLNSLRKNKQPTTDMMIHLFVPSAEINQFEDYLGELRTQTFDIHLMDVDMFANRVNTSLTIRDHLYYARCFFPQVFPQYDKLLYMDIDMVCARTGIEELWNTDIADYWVGAVIDPTWQYCAYFKHDPINCKTDHYFNNGMMLMNLKKLRDDGKDKEFAAWCLHWDKSKLICHCFDQTLCNYLLKDGVKLLPFKYNNSLVASLGIAEIAYSYHLNQCGYLDPIDSLQDAVLLHFCGSKKPWSAEALKCSTVDYPYKDEAVELWHEIVTKYGKN